MSLPTVVAAADGTWTYNTSSTTQNWSNTADWQSGIVADGGGFANFSTLSLLGARNIAIDTTSRTVRRLDIGTTNANGSTHVYTISATGGASLIFDNTANNANAQLNEVATSEGDTISAPISLNSSLDITNASAFALSLSGGITAGTTGTKTITTSNGIVTLSAIGTGTGNVAVVQNGSGTLTISGTNTYTGGVTINVGTVVAGSASALGAATGATLAFGPNSTGKFQLNGKGATIVGLSNDSTVGTPVIENASVTASTFNVNAANSSAFAGTIQDGTGGGALALTMGGAGSLTLSGSNSYSGLTTVSAGTLTMSGTNGSSGAVTVSGGVLQLNNASNGGLAGGTLTFGNGTVQAINADRTLSNNVSLTASTGATVSGAQNITVNGSFTQSGSSRTLTSSITGGNTLTLAGSVYLSEAQGTARVLTFGGTGNTTISGTIADSASGVTTDAVRTGGFTLNQTGGTLTVSNANTYSGATTLSQGNLSVGNKGAFGSSTVKLNGANVSASTDLSGANAIANTTTSGVSGATFGGTNNLELSGTFTNNIGVSGTNVISNNMSAGTLTFSNTFNLSGTANGSKTVNLAGTGNTLVSGVVADGTQTAGNLTKSGAGTLTLSNANTYGGTTAINAGTLILSPTGSINFSNSVQVTSGALTLQNANALSNNGTLSLSDFTTLNLGAGSGTTEVINGLVLNGTPVQAGTYAASDLSRMDGNITFTGGESLQVLSTVPEPATVFGGILLVGALGWTQRRRLGGLAGQRRNACAA